MELQTQAQCSNGKTYPVTLTREGAWWMLHIQCGLGAWGKWRLNTIADVTGGILVYGELACVNMGAIVREALARSVSDADLECT